MKRFGSQYKTNRGRPNYLGGKDQPFPENASFRSQPVLSEESREEIWRRVIVNGEAIKTVSATFGVDMRRVAAVVRLKEVEKSWISQVSDGSSVSLFRITNTIPACMMNTFNNSISLEDNIHGYTI